MKPTVSARPQIKRPAPAPELEQVQIYKPEPPIGRLKIKKKPSLPRAMEDACPFIVSGENEV